MTDFDPVLAATLDRLAPAEAGAPDWADVLARTRRRGRRRAAWAVAAAVGAAVLGVGVATGAGVETPIGGLLGLGKRPPLTATASLLPVAGSGSGTFAARPGPVFAPVGKERPLGFPLRISYVLTFRGLSGSATEAWLRVAPPLRRKGSGFVVRLCGPCRSPLHSWASHTDLVIALLTGRVTVEVATAKHPDGELRGQAMLRR